MQIEIIKLVNSKTGATKIMNASDFNASEEKDWKLATASKSSGTTSKSKASPAAKPVIEEAPKSVPVEDWTKMTWPNARKYIAKVSGTFPRNKAHAEELMSK